MKLSDGIIPHTEIWQEARIGKITASCLHKIFVNGQGKDKLIGVGGMTYINQKIGEILTQLMYDNVPETEDVLRGLGHEQFAKERYEEITGEMVNDSLLFQYNAIAAGTTDGQKVDKSGEIKGVLEIKCPRPHKHTQILAVDAPIELKAIDQQYYHQSQGNMMFTGADHTDFVSYCDEIKHYDLQIRIVRIYPDMDWRKDFVDRIEWIAEYMAGQLEKILKAPERNLSYRINNKEETIDKLKQVLENVQNITI